MARKKKRQYGPWSWTKEDIKLLKKLYPHGKTQQIADLLGRPLTTVRQKAYDLGIKTKIYNYWTDAQIKQLKKLYSKTPINTLSRKFKHSKDSVRMKAGQLGLKKRS
jgi:hypothetical protein